MTIFYKYFIAKSCSQSRFLNTMSMSKTTYFIEPKGVLASFSKRDCVYLKETNTSTTELTAGGSKAISTDVCQYRQ